MKIRLIWDDCTPTRDRRPTTSEDIENDIHLQEFESEEDLIKHLSDILGYDEDDLEDCGDTNRDKIDCLLSSNYDPGDGSPNILFLSIDGEIIEDWLEEVDGLTCSEEDVKKEMMRFVEDEPWDYDDDFEEEEKKQNTKYKGYNIWYDDEYANAYVITDDDGDDVTPGHTFKSVEDAMNEIDSGVAFPIEEKDEEEVEDDEESLTESLLKEDIEEEIKDYIKWCQDNKKEAKDAKSLKQYIDQLKNSEKSLTEASTAEKRSFNQGGEDIGDLIQGKAISRIKDPQARQAAVAAVRAGRPEVAKQFYGYRKEDQASAAIDKKMAKMQRSMDSNKDKDIIWPTEEEQKKAIKDRISRIRDQIHEDLQDYDPDEEFDQDLTDTFLDDLKSIDEPEKVEECSKPEWEEKKDRVLEYYNTIKEWAGDKAKDQTSSKYNIGLDQLNEWLGENKND